MRGIVNAGKNNSEEKSEKRGKTQETQVDKISGKYC